MSCNRYKNWILLESSGELPAKDSEDLHNHLLDCSECSAFARTMNLLADSSYSSQTEAPLPHPSVMVNIRQAAEENLQKHKLLWLPVYALRLTAYAAIFMLISGAALMTNISNRSEAARISALSTMVSMVSDIDENHSTAENEESLEAIAGQLLKMEGFDDEGMFDDEAMLSLFEEPDPTTTQWHNTHAPQAKISV